MKDKDKYPMRTILTYRYNPKNDKGQTTINAAEHRQAIETANIPTTSYQEFRQALKLMLLAWDDYRIAHYNRYEMRIGQDYVLGPYWAECGLAIKRLLDGETGGLDAGSIAKNISETINDQDIAHDGYILTPEKD